VVSLATGQCRTRRPARDRVAVRSDWDCGCRVRKCRGVVSAGGGRPRGRRGRAAGRRACGAGGDPNLLLLIAEVRTLPTGHCASCRTAPLHPVPRSHCETTQITVLGYPAIYVGTLVRRKLATATILNRQYIIPSFEHPGARALSSTPCQLQCSTLPPSFFRSCYVSTHME